MIMKRKQFTEQIRGAAAFSEEDAVSNVEARLAIGQRPVIRYLPCGSSDPHAESFWLDVAGKARVDDEVAPYFAGIGEKAMRGVAIWRSPSDNSSLGEE